MRVRVLYAVTSSEEWPRRRCHAPRPDDKKVPCRPVILRRQRRALRGSRANRVAATLNPKTTDKQFEALVARMMAKGWKDSTVGVVRDFRRAVLEQAAAKDEKATA
jgi:hypothetical protein